MGGKKETTNTVQDNSIDPFSQGLVTTATNNVRGILGSNPFEQFGGERVAGLNDQQLDARSQFQNGINQGAGLLDEAGNAARAAGGFTPERVNAQSFADADLSAFQNPFTEQVIDASLSDIDRQRGNAINDVNSQATLSGALGGDRQGVAQAETNRAFGDIAARTAAGLRSDAFNTSAGLFNQDANRQLGADQFNVNSGLQGAGLNLQAGGLLGQLGNFANQNNRDNASLSNLFGSQEQLTDQAGLDAAYQEFLRGQEDPFRRAQIELGLLGGAPVIQDGTTDTTRRTSGPGIVGLLGAGAQVASMFSDRRLKRDIQPLGKRGGHNWYSFKYAWDDIEREGVMADEVKLTNPELVTRHSSGFDMVNYGGL